MLFLQCGIQVENYTGQEREVGEVGGGKGSLSGIQRVQEEGQE